MKIDLAPLKKYMEEQSQITGQLNDGTIKPKFRYNCWRQSEKEEFKAPMRWQRDYDVLFLDTAGKIIFKMRGHYEPSVKFETVSGLELDENTGMIIVHYSNGGSVIAADLYKALRPEAGYVNDILTIPLNISEYSDTELRNWIWDITEMQASLIRKLYDVKIENSTDLCSYQKRLGYDPLFMNHRNGVVMLYRQENDNKFELVAITRNLKDFLCKNNYNVLLGGYSDWINYNRADSMERHPLLQGMLIKNNALVKNKDTWINLQSIDDECEFYSNLAVEMEYYYWCYESPATIADNEIYTGKKKVISLDSDFNEFKEYLEENGIDGITVNNSSNGKQLYIWGNLHKVAEGGIYIEFPSNSNYESVAAYFDKSINAENNCDKSSYEEVSYEDYAKCILRALHAGTFGIASFYSEFRYFLDENDNTKNLKEKLDDKFYVSYEGDYMYNCIGKHFYEDIDEPIIISKCDREGKELDSDKEEPEMENNNIEKMVIDTYKLCAKENKSAADEQAITEIFTNSIDKLSEVKLQLNEALSLIDKKDKELAEKDKQLKLIAAELKRAREQFASEKVPSEKVPEKKSPAKTRECSPDEFRAALRKTLDVAAPKKFTVHRFKDGKEELVLKQAAEDEHIQQFFLLLKKNNINRSTLISNKGYLSKEIAVKFVKFMQLKKYWK